MLNLKTKPSTPPVAQLALYNSALDMLATGQAWVILKGDTASDPASDGKAPAMSAWGNVPTQQDAAAAFLQDGYTAIGRVQGRFAGDPDRGEITLDIDDRRALDRLAAYPHLLDTFTELSCIRRLPHLSYEIAGELLDTPTRNGVYGSLRANGAYVVSAGSVIDGGVCEITKDRPRRRITKHDLTILLDVIGAPELEAYEREYAPETTNDTPTARTVINFYLNYPTGRNSAVFKALQYARDHGIPANSETIDELRRAFVNDPPRPSTGNRKYESPDRRAREFEATLASAYRRPARPAATINATAMLNEIRESLLKQKQDAAARLLDFLFTAGIEPRAALTEKQIVELCASKGIGRKTIRKAIAATIHRETTEDTPADVSEIDTETGEFIGKRIFVPICHTRQSSEPTTCVVRVADGDKNSRRGRPPGSGQAYTVPTIDYLLDMLGIERSRARHADALPASATQTAPQYRKSVHGALIRRAPGKYSMKWLSERVGVSRRTIRRYNNALGIAATPQYKYTPIGFSDVNAKLPEDADDYGRRGIFLEDGNGKKYKPARKVALSLLRHGVQVHLVEQIANHYAYAPKDTTERQGRIVEIAPAVENTAEGQYSRYNPFSRAREYHAVNSDTQTSSATPPDDRRSPTA